MDIKVNPKALHRAGEELEADTHQLSWCNAQLMDTAEELQRQASFRRHGRALEQIGNELDNDLRQLKKMTRILDNLSKLYERCEIRIAEQLDTPLPSFHPADAQIIWTATTMERVDSLLYGR